MHDKHPIAKSSKLILSICLTIWRKISKLMPQTFMGNDSVANKMLQTIQAEKKEIERQRIQLENAYIDVQETQQALKRDAVELPTKITACINKILEKNLTMTSKSNLINTALACLYVEENQLVGDFVECGVWRGGHSILAASILQTSPYNRKIYLFDTFQGMTPPNDIDVRHLDGATAKSLLEEDPEVACFCSLHDVRRNFRAMNVPEHRLKFVEGDVAETLLVPDNVPQNISILRLDTDFYASTKVELDVLFSKVTAGGIVIFDDYGYWQGQKRA